LAIQRSLNSVRGEPVTTVYYNYLGIRTLANDTVLNYQVSNAVGFYAGYQYSDRLINSVERRISRTGPRGKPTY
jgi:hypothetical protein